MTGIPTLANLQKGVQFVLKYQSLGQSVYVHCKAGRSRSATMVAAYLIQVGKAFLDWSHLEQISRISVAWSTGGALLEGGMSPV